MVREGGFEPPHPFGYWHLKPARLPFRHSRKVSIPTWPISKPSASWNHSENKHSGNLANTPKQHVKIPV